MTAPGTTVEAPPAPDPRTVGAHRWAPSGPEKHARVRSRLPAIFWVGTAVVGAFVLVGVFGGRLAEFRPTELAGDPLEAPGGSHLLGTNSVGQDVASQLLHGTRASLYIAVAAGGGTLLVGAVVGMLAGWRGGRADAVLMRFVDIVLVIPNLPLLIVLGAYAGPSMTAIAVIIAMTSWPPTSRVIRSQVLSLRQRAHLRASVGFGARTAHVLRRHVAPEVGMILAASFVGAASRAVMLEAGLAFLGLGDPTRASWGRVMRDAIDFDALFYTDAWSWWLVPPATAIALFLLGLTFVGIGVEQFVNPRLARHAR